MDFICIDQQNVQERNQQVHGMDTTYSGASLVVAWLGLEYEPPNWQSYEPMECLVYDGAEMQVCATELALRPYWNRRWVVQELRLAMNVQVLCGGHCISWSLFRTWLLDEQGEANSHVGPNDGALPFLLNKDESCVHYPSHSLRDLLLEYHQTSCRDPRDRVFALLGLLSNEERLLIDPLFPDYSLSHTEVVTKTMVHLGGVRLKKESGQTLPTEDCREMLEALGFKNMWRARELLCPD